MGIKEIAEAAGVSPAAVSLALNNRPGVSEETRARILSVADSMDYRARRDDAPSSSGTRKGTIRFVQVTKHGKVLNENHKVFVADYIEGLSRGCRNHNYYLQLVAQRTNRISDVLPKSREIRGVIVLGTELEEADMETFLGLHVPVVFLDTYHEYLPFDFVDMDNRDAVRKIVSYFHEAGHRRIGYVRCTTRTRNLKLREEAFLSSLADFGLEAAPDLTYAVDSTFEGAYRDMLRILENGRHLPTALFPGNDIIAYGCIKAMKEKGLRIPEDVSVIGFDDLPTSAIMDPPLTSVRVATRRMGSLAVGLLAIRLEDGSMPPLKLQVGVALVERQSVRKLAGEEPAADKIRT